MPRSGIVADYIAFLRQHKMWWIVPVIIALVMLGALLVVTQGSPLAPVIYNIF
jgi:uncharacterized MnhB-related membrane protein